MPDTVQRPASVVAPASWRAIDFISDLHLGEDTPRTFVAWADYLHGTTADAVVILGDLFEVWIGDDARGEGFEARSAAVLADAAAQRTVGFMVGNRDFLLGRAMLEACGVQALADPTLFSAFGERTLLTHGDAWCVSDIEYQQVRKLVRNPAWQRDVLARPLAERRVMARALRTASEQRHADSEPWFDIDPAIAVTALRAAGAPTLIHGHTHHPCDEKLATGYRRLVLSDWDLDHAGVPRAEVLRWSARGFERMTPRAATLASA